MAISSAPPSSIRRALPHAFLCAAIIASTFTSLFAQSPADDLPAQITDPSGTPIQGAEIRSESGTLLSTTDASGHATLHCAAPCTNPPSVTVQAPGFAPRTLPWQTGTIALQIATTQEVVSVTAYRSPLGGLESPVSTRILSSRDLQTAAPITLDGEIRMIAGAETFRRSSSLVANPSSQGISLRGLGSTSASRTLVTEDDVPLNDAFGGWIHWEEIPELSIHSIELVRGGASDLYGSSAIGGVINVLPQHPLNAVQLRSSYGSMNTYESSLLLSASNHGWGVLASGGVIGTDGFITVTPDSRGLVDTPSNVHAQNGVLFLERNKDTTRLFVRGSGMNEARANGTPVQTNGTRLWRYATGLDWNAALGGTLIMRAYGSTEHYRQTFSTIAADRNSEVLNRFALTPDNELGAVMHWSRAFSPGLVFLAGSDVHDVRALDVETTIRAGVPGYINLSDRQRQTGLYGELLYTRHAWTMSASGRYDWFSNFDGQRVQPTVNPLPEHSEGVFDPRLGIARKLGSHYALSASGFRAYRAPTPSELYRSTQVGSLLTLPNNNLLSERATGWETGAAMEQRWGTLRASYFWTRVNRPITALTLTPTTLMRENLGRIESRGVSADVQLQPTRWMTINGGYQYANATVTQNSANSNIVGNWIPQVAHHMGTAQVRAYRAAIGTLSVQGRISGHQFDDDANTYLLHSYFKLDAYASHDFTKRIEVFASGENLFDRSIEVGRTPTLTLGTPRAARIGFLLKLGPAN